MCFLKIYPSALHGKDGSNTFNIAKKSAASVWGRQALVSQLSPENQLTVTQLSAAIEQWTYNQLKFSNAPDLAEFLAIS